MTKPNVRKLTDPDYRCETCEGKLKKTSREELRKSNIFLNAAHVFPRGLWQCEDCGEIATVSVTPVSISSPDWQEVISGLSDGYLLNEQEFMATLMDVARVMPGRRESEVVTVSALVTCQGLGPGCRHYWLAACGLGTEAICGSKFCRYDPYSPSWYRKMQLDRERTSPLPNMVLHWKGELEKALATGNMASREDALRRLGAFAVIDKARTWLIGHAFDGGLPLNLREIAINALSNLNRPEQRASVKDCFLKLLSDDLEDVEVKRAVILAVRKMRFADVDLMEKIVRVSARRKLEKDAKVTLKILGKTAGIRGNK